MRGVPGTSEGPLVLPDPLRRTGTGASFTSLPPAFAPPAPPATLPPALEPAACAARLLPVLLLPVLPLPLWGPPPLPPLWVLLRLPPFLTFLPPADEADAADADVVEDEDAAGVAALFDPDDDTASDGPNLRFSPPADGCVPAGARAPARPAGVKGVAPPALGCVPGCGGADAAAAVRALPDRPSARGLRLLPCRDTPEPPAWLPGKRSTPGMPGNMAPLGRPGDVAPTAPAADAPIDRSKPGCPGYMLYCA